MQKLVAIFALVAVSGCAAQQYTPKHTVARSPIAMSHRCRTLGQATTPNASVIIHKNCIRNGVTTVAIVVYDKHNVKLAARDAVLVIKDLLGFAPTLQALVVGEDKNTPFILAVVTDDTAEPVAVK